MLKKVTLEAPVGNVVTLHDVTTGNTNAVGAALKSAAGLIGIPAPKEARREAFGQHGSRDRSRFIAERGPTFEGELWGVDHPAALARHDALVRALWATETDAPGILRYTRQDDLQLRALVKLASYDPPLENASRLLTYALALSQPEPRAFAEALVTTVGAALSGGGGGLTFPFTFPLQFLGSSGGRVDVVNSGTAPASVVVRAFGRAVAPRIRIVAIDGVNVTGGAEIVLLSEIPAGTFYQFDTAGPTATIAGGASVMSQVDPSLTTFFEIPAKRTVTLQLLASDWDAGAHLEADIRPAFGG